MRKTRTSALSLSLRSKAMLAVGVPLMIVAVVALLAAGIGHRGADRAEDAVQHEVAVRGALRTVQVDLQHAHVEVLNAVATGEAGLEGEFHDEIDATNKSLAAFVALAGSQHGAAKGIGTSVRANLSDLEALEEAAASGPPGVVRAAMTRAEARMEETRSIIDTDWTTSQHRLAVDLHRADQAIHIGFDTVVWLVLVGGLGGVLIGAGLFSAAIGRRVRRLTANAQRLIDEEALSPPGTGDDEIATLDRRLHQAATMLGERRTQLEEREAQYRSIVETAHEGVWTVDSLGLTTFVNSRMSEMLGRSPEELIGRSPMEFMDDEGRELFVTTMATLQEQTSVQVEGALRHRDGSAVWALLETSAFVDADGSFAGALAMVTDVTERRHLSNEIEFNALHDTLTGLPNRRLFHDLLQGYAASVDDRSRAVMLIDLDRFKVVNDSLGHGAGDIVLRGVAERLSAAVRAGDVVARLGGDEFVVLCNVAGPDDALRIANRLLEAIDQPIVVEGRCVQLSASAGVAVYEGGSARPDDLVRDADVAMYAAKRQGSGRAQLFSEALGKDAVSKLQVESDLRAAIAGGELTLHYQPQVSLITEEVVGVEALVRWNHPTRGLVPPNEFIPVAEETGLIVPLGTWVLTEACRQAAVWVRTVPALAVPVSVNVSSHQLAHSDVAGLTSAILRDARLEAKWLTLEVTESALMADPEAAAATLADLHALGVGVSIDDFGTGYSSLAYLQRFPVDSLKVDRTFVKGLGTEVDESAIVTAVVALSKALVLSTVAEGVETVEQHRRLRSLGCEIGQGFLWSKPLPAPELERWATTRRASAAVPVQSQQTATRAFRALIVDDVAAHRAAVSRMLGRSAWFDVVGEASDGEDAISACALLHPDLVVLDVSMPGMSGLEALPRILEQAPDTKVVLLSGVIGPEDAAHSVTDGAAAFLRKGLTSKRLVDELMEVMAG